MIAALRQHLRQFSASTVVRNAAGTMATRVVLLVIGLATTVLVSRILGPEGRGLVVVVSTVGGIGVQLANLGLHAANTYAIARDRGLLPVLLGNSAIICVGWGGIVALLAYLLCRAVPDLAPLQGPLLLVACLSIPFGLGQLLLQNMFLGISDFRRFNAADILPRCLTLAGVVALILVDRVDAFTVSVISVAATVVTVTWMAWSLARKAEGRISASLPQARGMLGYGLRSWVANMLGFLVLRVDILMIQAINGASDTGIYSVAVALADLALMLATVVGTVLFPRLTAERDPAWRWRITIIAAGGTVLATALGLAVVASVAAPAITLVFGEAFRPAAEPFLWLCPAIVLLAGNTILMNYFAALGMPRITIYSPLFATIVNVALNLVLIPSHGPSGAAMASVAAYGSMVGASLIYLSLTKPWRA